MKTKHYAIVALIIIACLFLYHNYTTKGGVAGIKSGIGLGS